MIISDSEDAALAQQLQQQHQQLTAATPVGFTYPLTEEGEEKLRERRESAAEYETASEKVGAAFLEIGGAKFAANYFGRIPGRHGGLASTTPATFFNEQQAKALESTYKPSLTTTTRNIRPLPRT